MTKQEALKALSCIANSWGTGCEEKVDAHNTISRLINHHFDMVERVEKDAKVIYRLTSVEDDCGCADVNRIIDELLEAL